MTLDGLLSNDETTSIISDEGYLEGVFEHTLDAKIFNAGYEPSIIFNPFGALNISTGIRFAYIYQAEYSQEERIKSPEGFGTFIDSLGNDTHERVRNKYSGDIPEIQPYQLHIVGRINYELPLNKRNTWLLVPEISYYYPITEIVKNTNWKISSIAAGLSLKYSFQSKIKEIRMDEITIDTVKMLSELYLDNRYIKGKEVFKSSYISEKTEDLIVWTDSYKRTDTFLLAYNGNIEAKIIACGVDSLYREIENPEFIIEEFVSNKLTPLLNYVFFDHNSSDIPYRYKQLDANQAEEFSIGYLYYDKTLEMYSNILNIVGKRLTDNPEANIILLGCNSNIEEENNNLELSLERAEAIKKYLVDIWRINANRIEVKRRNLPEKYSSPANEIDRIEENRRVEIYSDNLKILEPIFIEKLDRMVNPPIARFKIKAESSVGIADWEINAFQSSDKTRNFIKTGKGNPPAYIDWVFGEDQRIIPDKKEEILYSLTVKDYNGNLQISGVKSIPVDIISIQNKRTERIDDIEYEKFNLILFDFNNASIETENQRILDFISNRIQPEAEIYIKGYTDRTGDANYNGILSENRAKSVKSSLMRSIVETTGYGESVLLFDNELPEGRFYCRTVEIFVKTQVKNKD